jgi:hypothetical protein
MLGVTVMIPSNILVTVFDRSTVSTSKRYLPAFILSVLAAASDIVISPAEGVVIVQTILAVAFAE